MQQRKPIKTPPRNPHSPHLKTFPFPFPIPTLKSILISMASLFSLLLLSMLLFFSLTVASNNHNRRNSPKPSLSPPADPGSVSVPSEIRQACKATRFPDSCVSSLATTAGIPSNPNPVQILQLALRISSENLDKAQTMVEEILGASSNNLNRTTAAKNCLETLGNSAYRLRSTAEAVARGRIKDGRAWLSAALLYQYDCWSGLKYANDTKMVGNTMSFLTSLIGFSSNALSMLASYDIFGNETRSWLPPRTERDGSWEGISGSGSGSDIISVPTGLKPDVTVCKDGSGGGCDFSTVQAAVDAAPGTRRFVVLIKAGVYEETVRVGLEKKFVVFLGEGTGKTVITGSSYSGQPGITTYNSATVGVMGDGFMARDLTMENTAGPDAHQAVAFRSDSDLSVIENCEFLGNQDTLYAHSLRQLYKSCHIEGNVDFIFGNSASIFQNCTILVRPRQVKPEKGENNAITAQGRTDPAQSTGFVFQDCLINGTDAYMALYNSKPSVHKNFLGRPWKEYSRTMFIKCNLEALISPAGWMPWSGDFALKTLYYGEFDNSGPGANTSARVSWSSQIPAEHVDAYSVQNFIQGDEWLPTTS